MDAIRKTLLVALTLALASCESTYYDAMEQFGIHKRDILVDRIEDAQEAQEDGQEQFRDALEQFRSVVNCDGGELETVYNKLNGEYEDSVAAADEIGSRIDSVESVAEALFDEWQDELGQYSNASLRRSSEQQLRETRTRYNRVISAMRNAERSIEPVLASLKDNTLYLKHNLNARAIASLKGELGNVDRDIGALITAMQSAIDESNRFIEEMRGEGQG